MVQNKFIIRAVAAAFIIIGGIGGLFLSQPSPPVVTPILPIEDIPDPPEDTELPQPDVEPPAIPELGVQISQIGFIDDLGSSHDIVVAGNYAYGADSFNGPHILDISDRNNPREVGSFDPPGSTSGLGVFFSDPYVYLSDGLVILDVSDPTAPFEVGFYHSPGFSVKTSLSGDYAYVADREGGLRIANISDVANPNLVSNFFEAGSAHVLDVFPAGPWSMLRWMGLA